MLRHAQQRPTTRGRAVQSEAHGLYTAGLPGFKIFIFYFFISSKKLNTSLIPSEKLNTFYYPIREIKYLLYLPYLSHLLGTAIPWHRQTDFKIIFILYVKTRAVNYHAQILKSSLFYMFRHMQRTIMHKF